MKVSIICPVYNAEKTIEETIESVVIQTYQDWELLLINDQSNDDTEKVIKANKYFQLLNKQKIFLYNTEDVHDKGIVAALNYGISKANGDLIARIDSDDLMLSERLEVQVNAFKNFQQLNLIAGDAVIIDDSGKEIGSSLISTTELSNLDERCCIVHPSVMWRKEYFDKHNLIYNKEFEYAEDYDLWMRFRSSPEPTYAKINKPIIKYRVSSKSISSTKRSLQKERIRKIFKTYNISPWISVFNLNKNNKNFENEIAQQNYENYEIIENLNEAKGKYICFSGFENQINRLSQQVQILMHNKELIGCGTYIKKKEGDFFYTPDPSLIELELLKGHIIIEPATFMMKNCPDAYHNLDKENPDFFKLYCNLLKFGKLINVQIPLVKNDNYESIKPSDLVNKMNYAKEQYKSIRNVVQLNISSAGNFSGVDRYLKTMEENIESNIRITRITLIAGNEIKWELNQKHKLIYYNSQGTVLESMYDMFWDNLKQYFILPNLIVQSNCLNLFTLVTYLRRKVKLVHVCAVHCIPYREVIRFDRNKYTEQEKLFADTDKDFPETPEHILPMILADHVILNTKDSEEYFNRCGHLTPYSVIYNGVEKINKIDYKAHTPFRWIFVGHSSPLKGIDQLIRIVEIVSKQYNLEVWWAGAADPQLTKIIQEKNIPIKSLGIVHPDRLNQLYTEVDGALIATACETCSYAALEAISANLPIVATRAHGVTEILENVGLLVDIDGSGKINSQMYEDAMIKIMTDETLREKMKERAKERLELYTAQKMVTQLSNLYQKLLI